MKFNVLLGPQYKKRAVDIHDAILRIIATDRDLDFILHPNLDHLIASIRVEKDWVGAVMFYPPDARALFENSPLEGPYSIRFGRIDYKDSFLADCRNGTMTVEHFIPGEWEELLIGGKKSDKKLKLPQRQTSLGHWQSADQTSIAAQ
jgi:hypothetical protein